MSNCTNHFSETITQPEGDPIVVEVSTWHDAGNVSRLYVDAGEELTATTARALLHSVARAVTVLEDLEGELDPRLNGLLSL
ncbi:hypothetical protein QM588_05185 [Rhodococcus sp. IEGM 1354]|uniref:hypothetical protein n=1 Tax=Rhodococcus sp. IEGM 1354 TaxID=3047088 RepID=UPI0024B6DA56|nr:hypothetical protein [Rhodococcus sp. IEGM 1354]MDI9929791.1 hypothetical protein [Rhodococcus sp. IEGM 1354]